MGRARYRVACACIAAATSACLNLDTSGPGAATSGGVPDTTSAGPTESSSGPSSDSSSTTSDSAATTSSGGGSSSDSGAEVTTSASVGSTTGEVFPWDAFGEPVPLPGLSSGDDERSASQRSNGNIIALQRGDVREFVLNGATWTNPHPDVIFSSINERPSVKAPRVTGDGMYIYFSDTLDPTYVRRWNSIATIVDVVVETPESSESWFAPDTSRKMAIYVSDQAGSDDLFTTARADVGSPWGDGSPVVDANGAGAEQSPTLARDGTLLMFVSDSHGPNGKEIYRLSGGNEGVPLVVEELSDPSLPEVDVWLSEDGNTVLFAREEPGGVADIYMATR